MTIREQKLQTILISCIVISYIFFFLLSFRNDTNLEHHRSNTSFSVCTTQPGADNLKVFMAMPALIEDGQGLPVSKRQRTVQLQTPEQKKESQSRIFSHYRVSDPRCDSLISNTAAIH